MPRAALLLALVSISASAQTYTVTVVSPPSGLTSVMMSGINNSGQVAGVGYNGTTFQAFVGSPSGSIAIPLPSGWTSATGVAINALGQVAGYGNHGGIVQAFIGTSSGSTAIPLPPGWTNAYGYAINGSGQVAGWVSNGSNVQAFVGNTSGSTVIPLPPGWTSAMAEAINDAGQVAGYGGNGTSFGSFVGTASGSTAIPLPSGWTVNSINNVGQVAGVATPPGQGFIATTSGAGMLIPFPSGVTGTIAPRNSLNDLGMVFGISNVSGFFSPWVWDATHGTRLLNNLAPPGWVLVNSTGGGGISNTGLILLQGSYNGGGFQYVELSPALPSTSSPSALVLVLIGAAFVWLNRSRLLRQVNRDPWKSISSEALKES